MQTIQIVLDDELLAAANVAAEKARINRSALMRDALRAHLKRLKIKEMEERTARAYQEKPDTDDDLVGWEKMAVWPED